MLEQHYLQDLGWAGVFRGRKIAYWVAPGDDVQNPSHRFQHDEAVTAVKLPTDFDELESWGEPFKPIAERRQTDPLPPEVKATLLAVIESDVRVAEAAALVTAGLAAPVITRGQNKSGRTC